MQQAWKLGLNVVVRLEPQYSAWGCTDGACNVPGRGVCFGAQPGQPNWPLPDPTQTWKGQLRATHDPGSNHKSYRKVAETYAKLAASLPKPPDGSKLFVQIGNGACARVLVRARAHVCLTALHDCHCHARTTMSLSTVVWVSAELNLAWGCDCESENVCMSMEAVAAENAYFARDAVAALKQVPGLAIAINPVAPIGLAARPCCANATQCHAIARNPADCACAGGSNITLTSLSYEKLLIKAVPDLFKDVDWFSSHAYPCAGDGSGGPHDGCGLHGDPRPCVRRTLYNFQLAADSFISVCKERRLKFVQRQRHSSRVTHAPRCMTV